MQFPGQAPIPGVIYCTTMRRPDSALALALLFGLQGKREARVGAVVLSEAGLNAAAFCDAVARFYAGPGPLANSNRALPVGLAAYGPLPPDSPMVTAVMARRDEKGEPVFPHSIKRISDTSEPVAVIHNAITAQSDGKAIVVLSSPATCLARVLDLQGAHELISAKVEFLVICDSGEPQDINAVRRVLAEWPAPIIFCGKEAGKAILYPAVSIERDFAWSSAHPVAEAYRAFRTMPYDAPSCDLAAMLFAVKSDKALFDLSPAGTIEVDPGGSLTFTVTPKGKQRSIVINPAQRVSILKEYIEIASAKPVPRPGIRPKPAVAPAIVVP